MFKPIIGFTRKQTHSILDNVFVFYKMDEGGVKTRTLPFCTLGEERRGRIERSEGHWGP